MFNVFPAVVFDHNGKEERVSVVDDDCNSVAVGKAAREHQALAEDLLGKILRPKAGEIMDSCLFELMQKKLGIVLLLVA